MARTLFSTDKTLLVGALIASLATTLGATASAQAPADSLCRTRLSAASPDSQVIQLAMIVRAVDAPELLTPQFAALIGQGIVQMTRLPGVLPLEVYESSSNEAWPTVKGAYRATLRRDGHLTAARTVGGTRAADVDKSIVAAIVALDTSGMLPPPDSAMMGAADSVALSILVTTERIWRTNKPPATVAMASGVVPFLRVRVPLREGNGGASAQRGNRAPLYPSAMRQQNASGQTLFEFVVKVDGTPDMSSIRVLQASAVPFVQAVVDALPAMRFSPLLVEGCPVASLVQMPFQFSVTPPKP